MNTVFPGISSDYFSVSIEKISGNIIAVDKLVIQYADKKPVFPYDPVRAIDKHWYKNGGHQGPIRNSLIWGENLNNVTISGEGMINGENLSRKDLNLPPWDDPYWSNQDSWEDYPNQGVLGVGDKAIALRECINATIRDITIFSGGHYSILPVGCDSLLIENVTIDTHRDGIDITCCKNFIIRNCKVNAQSDDAICLKSSLVMGKRVPCEKGLIENCFVSGYKKGTYLNGKKQPLNSSGKIGNGRIKFGTESEGGFRNIAIKNIVFEHCYGLAIEEVDGGLIENIVVDGITMKKIRQYGIYITTGTRYRSPKAPGRITSKIKGVTIRNVTIEDCSAESGIQIHGLPDEPLEGITLENITLLAVGGGTASDAQLTPKELGGGYPEPKNLGRMPSYGLYVRHVKGATFKNIKFSTKEKDMRPAVIVKNVQQIKFDSINVQGNVDVEQYETRGTVKKVQITNSPALEYQK